MHSFDHTEYKEMEVLLTELKQFVFIYFQFKAWDKNLHSNIKFSHKILNLNNIQKDCKVQNKQKQIHK